MLTIKPHPLSAGTFNTDLYQFLQTKIVEGVYGFVYLDKNNIPTLGAGYALLIKNQNGGCQGDGSVDTIMSIEPSP